MLVLRSIHFSNGMHHLKLCCESGKCFGLYNQFKTCAIYLNLHFMSPKEIFSIMSCDYREIMAVTAGVTNGFGIDRLHSVWLKLWLVSKLMLITFHVLKVATCNHCTCHGLWKSKTYRTCCRCIYNVIAPKIRCGLNWPYGKPVLATHHILYTLRV